MGSMTKVTVAFTTRTKCPVRDPYPVVHNGGLAFRSMGARPAKGADSKQHRAIILAATMKPHSVKVRARPALARFWRPNAWAARAGPLALSSLPLFIGLLPPPVTRQQLTRSNGDDLPPSLHGHYPASSLLQGSPPLSGASVLSASRLEPLVPFPLASPARFSRSVPEPGRASRRLHAGCRSGRIRTSPELIPEEGSPPGFDIA